MALTPVNVSAGVALTPVDVLVVGSVNMDLVVKVARAPDTGETVLGESLAAYPGGKGANQAVAAARLGATVRLAARVGADGHGRELIQTIAAAGADVSAMDAVAAVPTGTAVILVEPSGENRIVVVPGANSHLRPEALTPELFAKARVVLVSQEIPAETVLRALELGRAAGCITLLNPAPARPLPPAALALVDVLVPNRTEAALLAGRPVESVADARLAAHLLLEQGAGTVVITLGSQGALVVRDSQSELVPAYLVDPVDTTAAGDGFCGALAATLARSEPVLAAVGYGAAAAAVAVTRPGAQPSLPTAAEVNQFLHGRG